MRENRATSASRDTGRHCDVIIIGAGFAGMYMLYRLREAGFSARVFEAGSDVGGTWYWNRYPGARCDVESIDYSYSFSPELEQDWDWTERFPTQPEVLRYASYVADRFDLRRDIQFDTRVTAAAYDDETATWEVATDRGDRVRSQFLISAMGCLSVPKDPEVDGVKTFEGQVLHTGRWPRERVEFAGKRVAVIGTGSSGIQVIPEIAKEAKHLYVLQRTPAYSLPARNQPLTAERLAELKSRYRELRDRARNSGGGHAMFEFGTKSALAVSDDERRRRYDSAWEKGGPAVLFAFNDVRTSEESARLAGDYVREQISSIVRAAEVARLLTPTEYPIGTKRICLDTDYYATFNRYNVTLVDLRSDPMQRVVADGIELASGVLDVDCIVFASGFDAMTGALLRLNPRGRGGRSLVDAWSAGPRTYLGLAIAGFPNLLTITGPGSPSVLSNMIVSIEQHVEWITACLEHLRAANVTEIEADEAAQTSWVEHVREVAERTLYPRAKSWYMGANVPGKPRVFMPYVGGVNVYREICATVAAKRYEGFFLRNSEPPAPPRSTEPATASGRPS